MRIREALVVALKHERSERAFRERSVEKPPAVPKSVSQGAGCLQGYDQAVG